MNFFFSSGTLLISHIIVNNKMAPFFGINVLTVFYIGFILYAVFSILFDKKITSFYTSLNILIFTVLLSSFNITMTLFVPHVLEVSVIMFFSGIFYGFTLAGFSVVTLQYIKSDKASIFYSKIDTYGRSGFLFSYMITGLAIDAAIDEVFILQVLNSFGILGAITIYILFRKHTEEKELANEKS